MHRSLLVSALVCLFCSVSVAPVCAQQLNLQDESQQWQGVLDVGAARLQLNFELKNEDDVWSGDIYSPDQGNARIPISSVEFDGDDVTIEASSVLAKFTGTLNESQNKITGTWAQGGNTWEFEIERVESFETAEHIESWKGTLVADPQEFEFRIRLFRDSQGQISGKLDSFTENLMGLPLELDMNDEKFNFELKISAAAYEGTFDEDREKLSGTWKQAGGEYPLEFEKTELDARPVINRPQHPEKPYPYDEEQVTWENTDDNVTLAGTLTIPKGDGPFPAMILISGSGPQDRDETIFEHKPFLVIADHLTQKGIAVLRFDDRGVGESTGNFATATSEDFACDVSAGVDFLTSHPGIDASKIGLIGHSEGGLIAPIVANDTDKVAMIVLLAGPGVDGGEILVSQTRAMAEAAGASSELIDAQEKLMTTLVERLSGSDEELTSDYLDSVVDEVTATLEDADKQALQAAKGSMIQFGTPWFRYFVRHDPAGTLKMVKCPVLAINGTKDLQVLADLNVDAIQAALEAGENGDWEVQKLANLNHLFQETDGPGLGAEYGQLEETFSPTALEVISTWLLDRVR